jgi:hypothetical protein
MNEIIDIDKVLIDDRDEVIGRYDLMERYAVMSSIAYELYNNPRGAPKSLKEFLPDHSLLEQFSDSSSAVIRNDNTRDLTIAYRGTVDIGDVFTDITQVATGAPSEKIGNIPLGRFRTAQEKFDAVREAYPTSPITTTGHSLGGSLAYVTGKRNNVPSFVFNMGSSPLDLFTDAGLTHTLSNQSTHYHVAGDLVGESSSLQVSLLSNAESGTKLITIEPNKWIKDLAGSLGLAGIGAVVAGPLGAGIGGLLGAGYSYGVDLHGLHNFMPKEAFKPLIEPDDLAYRWVKPIHDKMKEESRISKRDNLNDFSHALPINRDDLLDRIINKFTSEKLCDRKAKLKDPRCKFKK